MSEISSAPRHRKPHTTPTVSNNNEGNGLTPLGSSELAEIESSGSDDDDGDEQLMASMDSEEEEDTTSSNIQPEPQSTGTDKVPYILRNALAGMSRKWKNGIVRGIFTIVMITGFFLILLAGPVIIMLLVLAIQIMCYYELISIGYAVYRTHKLPWFRTLGWYLLFWFNYFLYGEFLVDIFYSYITAEVPQFLITYHRLISLMLYVTGFIWFVLSLKKGFYFRQFSMFAYINVTLIIVVVSSYLLIKNVFQGPIWFFLPVSLIICNDIMAYIFGMLFGKTPLIKLSPKKTWEGFIGGLVGTLIFGALVSHILIYFNVALCPIDMDTYYYTSDCVIPVAFRPKTYTISTHLFHWQFTTRPIHVHGLAFALFSAVIGPFGGFFASGLKRAFKVKDFGDLIPGHGGVVDRFDCQFLMAAFVYVYLNNVILHASPQTVMKLVMRMTWQEQLDVYHMLTDYLSQKGAL